MHADRQIVVWDVSRIAAMGVLILGIAVLIGWQLNIDVLKRVVPGFPTMNPLTALCFVVSAWALWLSLSRSNFSHYLSLALSLLVLSVAAWDLLSILMKHQFAPDEILFAQSINATIPQSRMAASTAAGFMLTTAALFLSTSKQTNRRVAGQYAAFAQAFIAIFAIIGYVYGAGTVRTLAPFSLMALHTSWGLLVLSVGVLFIDPSTGPMSLVLSSGLAGRLLRMMTPAVILVPMITGWACIHGLRSGSYGPELALTLLAGVSMMLLFGAALLTGSTVQDNDLQRKRRLEVLRASEARISGILAIAADAIISVDSNQRITLFNAWAEKIFGYSRDEAMGQPLEFLLPERLREEHIQQVKKFGAGRVDARRMGERREIFARKKDGSEFPAEASISKFIDDGQTVFTVVLRDMTESRRAADALLDAKERAEVAARSESEFLANMSHEIRTPLNSISGFTQILLGRQNLLPEVRAIVAKIKHSTAALTTIVNDILDYARLEKGKVVLSPTPFSIAGLVNNCMSIISSTQMRQDLHIEASVAPELEDRYYLSDPDRLQQILLNLLSNAVKFTLDGSIVLTVTEDRNEAGEQCVHFCVADTGIGIPAEHIDRLFQRFSQVDASVSRNYGGTGLGLAICKRLVEILGGEIGVRSEPGKGSTFWFRLPMHQTTAPIEVRREIGGLKRRSAVRRSILLVEDVDLNREIAVAMLEGAGHRVDVATNGTEAVSKAASNGYDLVLMDIQMPVMDGISATERIRALKENSAVPIVAMTANVLPDEVARFYAAGMNGHIRKPVDLDELIAGVERWARGGDAAIGGPG
ncbi:ATP-binding protein [Hyphomicrobium sp. NDB2Meth4]|uniref:PAS domain-containing hybrid sensor histidine kinase/response regulator n=1 Tax=Hyphomicrobium sp. NDB2Meth4 TaxID=1892846 RepID=UPI00093201DE|nr:ATP-binding protein [Hyphomicrobium sp. NDB2Meth4]